VTPIGNPRSDRRSGQCRSGRAVLAEQHDEWAEGRRYLGRDVLARTQPLETTPTTEEVIQPAIYALTAQPTTAKDHRSRTPRHRT
jgi:hypothetical protein